MCTNPADLLESMVGMDSEICLKDFNGLCQTYFTGAWKGMSEESWTQRNRERVRDILRQSLEMECSAISLIESALKKA